MDKMNLALWRSVGVVSLGNMKEIQKLQILAAAEADSPEVFTSSLKSRTGPSTYLSRGQVTLLLLRRII